MTKMKIFLMICGVLSISFSLFAEELSEETVGKAERKHTFLAKKTTLTAVVDRLIQSLKYGDSQVKEAAATALGMIGDERAVEPLIEVLERSEGRTLTSVHLKIVEALERIGNEKALAALDKLWSNETLESNRIKKLKRDVNPSKKVDSLDMLLERMIIILSDDDMTTILDRGNAIVTLGMVGDKRAVKPLLEILKKDEESYLEIPILQAFGRIKDPEVVPVLLKMLKVKNTTPERILIVSTLGEIGDKRAVPALEKMLEEMKGKKKKFVYTFTVRDALAKITGEDSGTPPFSMKDDDVAEFMSDLLGEDYVKEWQEKKLKTEKKYAMKTSCISNLRQISIGLRMYASDNDFKFPEKLDDLYPKYVTAGREIFKCPATGLAYGYIPGLTEFSDSDSIIAFDKKGNHKGGRNVLFLAGYAKWMKEEEFQKALIETTERAK